MITKQQIEACNDGQQLADWAAEYCMGWALDEKSGVWATPDFFTMWEDYDGWQPHQPTEKGKSQAIDLAEKYSLVLYPASPAVFIPMMPDVILGETWQLAILKAALLSEIGE